MSWATSGVEGWWCGPRAGWTCRPSSLDVCLREVGIDFVLTATPRAVTPRFIVEAVDRGLPVLAETPPAPISQVFARCGRRWATLGWSRWPNSIR